MVWECEGGCELSGARGNVSVGVCGWCGNVRVGVSVSGGGCECGCECGWCGNVRVGVS